MLLPPSSGQEPLPSTLSIGMRGGVDCIGKPFTRPRPFDGS